MAPAPNSGDFLTKLPQVTLKIIVTMKVPNGHGATQLSNAVFRPRMQTHSEQLSSQDKQQGAKVLVLA